MVSSGEDAAEVAADHWPLRGFVAAGAFDGGLFLVGDLLGALLGAVGDDALEILNLVQQYIDLLILLGQLLLLLQVHLPQPAHSALQRLHIFLLNLQRLLGLLVLALDGLGVLDVVRIGALEERPASGGAVAVVIHYLNTCIMQLGKCLVLNESGRLGLG